MKKRDKRSKQESRTKGGKQESRATKQETRGSKRQAGSGAGASAAVVRDRSKRSGVEAVKLHLEVTGHTGRTSRSATSVNLTLYLFPKHKALLTKLLTFVSILWMETL